MEKREFGKLNARFLGKFMGLDLYAISTLPVYIETVLSTSTLR